jgi:hypothetical protein
LRQPENNPTDAGSALPLLLAGLLFLVVFGAVLLGSLQLLEQQRRLNGISDTLALDATERLVQQPTSDSRTLSVYLGSDAKAIYPNHRVTLEQVAVAKPDAVEVAVCEPAQATLASVLGLSAKQVCATSRAAAQ